MAAAQCSGPFLRSNCPKSDRRNGQRQCSGPFLRSDCPKI
ncbi:MAG: hypothetical protein JNK57_19310 [Planctomycetaceae bacterium]|nr:hypothetical protein [Planctomycetaceae bacterium]